MNDDELEGDASQFPFLLGLMNLDDAIGSLLQNWLTANCPAGYCRFCRKAVDARLKPAVQFCNKTCKENFQIVAKARAVIGERDLRRRGFD
jgi:hypothetical protein